MKYTVEMVVTKTADVAVEIEAPNSAVAMDEAYGMYEQGAFDDAEFFTDDCIIRDVVEEE